MNMPFELGMDFGCKNYGNDKVHLDKKFLIIGDKEYEYMKALSDISGIDIQYHRNKQENLISSIRDWFVTNEKVNNVPSPKQIWCKFMDFHDFYSRSLLGKGYQKNEIFGIPIIEQIAYMEDFLKEMPYYIEKRREK